MKPRTNSPAHEDRTGAVWLAPRPFPHNQPSQPTPKGHTDMSARDNIRSKVTADVDGFRSEVVTVPEWDDEKVLVRAASAADKRAWRARSRKFVEVVGGYEVVPVEDLLGDIFLVVRCTYELDGSRRVFTDDDVDMLAAGGESTDAAIARLYDAAVRASGFVDDESDDAGKASEGSEPTTA